MSYRCVTINISLLFQDNKMKFSGYEICLAWLEIDQSTCKYKNQPDLTFTGFDVVTGDDDWLSV